MPPKPPRPAAAKAKTGEESKEEPLQAVVVADTFERKFAPFTLERPQCLLPLANTPLIEYTLEHLASAGVQEVYIYAGAHVDQVERYINASRWKSSASPFKKLVFLRCVASSVGDVMRDLDQKALMTGDFVAVSGDIVSTFPIERALKQHRSRREKDKNAIMTMLLREAGPGPYQPGSSVAPTFVIDPTKDRCLHYDEGLLSASFNAHIDAELLKTPEIDIRQDLIDCRIDICTPDVLSLWSDNFDNQAPRKDFLYGVLKDYELNGKTIHTYIIKDRYASRAGDLLSYAAISHDLRHRFVPSIAVENNVFGNSHYKWSRRGYIQDRDVTTARPSHIEPGSIIGSGTSVGAGSRLRESVVGHRCQIGQDATIDAAYVWDDVTIGNNVKILRAIIGNDVVIGDNCTIAEGALISYGVRVAPGTTVPAGSRITTVPQPGVAAPRGDALVGGADGEGHEYKDEDEEEDDDNHNMIISASTAPGLVYQMPNFAESTSTLSSEVSRPSSSIDRSRSQSFATSVSDEDGSDRFQTDTVAILVQRMQEGKQADDMLSELMGLRFSGGADETQVRKAVAAALVKHIHNEIDAGLTAAEASRRTLTAYHTLIRRTKAEQTTEEQVLFLLDAQKELTRKDGGKTLLFVVKDLYDLDVFGEDSFLAWWGDERSNKEPDMAQVRLQAAPFIDWLENAESESESEDDEEDE